MTLSSLSLILSLLAPAQAGQPTCRSPVPFDATTIQVGTGGTWQEGQRYGRFRYLVFSHGSEHTTHTVEVEVLEYVPRNDAQGRIDTRVVGCVRTGALTRPFEWWVESIRIEIDAARRSMLRLELAHAEKSEQTREHVLELRRDGRLRIVREAFPR
jgi:hypothetical protein